MQQEMKYVYEVYREGSFSKAAQKLYLSQPALSIAIHKVEKELGMPIFERGKQPLILTTVGEIYIKMVREMYLMEEELSRKIHDLAELKSGTIRIGGTNYFNSYVLPPVLNLFMSKYPNVEIQLVEASSTETAQLLIDNCIDFAFSCNTVQHDKFDYQPVFEDTILLAVPADFSVNNLLKPYIVTVDQIMQGDYTEVVNIDLKQFAETPFIFLSPPNNLYERSLAFFQTVHVEPNIRLVVEQLATAYHLACQGIGATFISALLVKSEKENMCYYALDTAVSKRCFDILLPKRKYIPNTVKKFIHTMLEIYQ